MEPVMRTLMGLVFWGLKPKFKKKPEASGERFGLAAGEARLSGRHLQQV